MCKKLLGAWRVGPAVHSQPQNDILPSGRDAIQNPPHLVLSLKKLPHPHRGFALFWRERPEMELEAKQPAPLLESKIGNKKMIRFHHLIGEGGSEVSRASAGPFAAPREGSTSHQKGYSVSLNIERSFTEVKGWLDFCSHAGSVPSG